MRTNKSRADRLFHHHSKPFWFESPTWQGNWQPIDSIEQNEGKRDHGVIIIIIIMSLNPLDSSKIGIFWFCCDYILSGDHISQRVLERLRWSGRGVKSATQAQTLVTECARGGETATQKRSGAFPGCERAHKRRRCSQRSIKDGQARKCPLCFVLMWSGCS